MIYTKEVENMCPVAKGAKHEPAPIPEEGKWVHSKKIEDISGFTHGVGWCAPQQGACKLSLNVKNGVIEEALGLKHLNDRALVFKRWRISVNHPVFLTVKAFASVECISEHVKQSAQGLISNRNLDTAALGNNLHILA